MPTIVVSRGFTYNYQHFPPTVLDGKYVLFLHGWPSVANEWHNQIDHFRKLGWGVVAPDLLGSGRTSRPTEVDKYILKDIAKDVVEILDYENISKVNAVGHDWGSTLLSRLAVYHSERIDRLCFLTVGYRPPGTPFSLEAANKMATQKLGHTIFGYQEFFMRNEKSQKILNEHVSDQLVIKIFSVKPFTY
jgi:soluble epoxide hydrolase/lipid-phosphate phosphatase